MEIKINIAKPTPNHKKANVYIVGFVVNQREVRAVSVLNVHFPKPAKCGSRTGSTGRLSFCLRRLTATTRHADGRCQIHPGEMQFRDVRRATVLYRSAKARDKIRTATFTSFAPLA
jgi:hypothetical protein